jgi:pimeloyl-ACP methyl ester carboxylesterase
MRYIFIHGLGQKPSSWDKIVALMGENVQAVCPDLFTLISDREITYANLYHSFSDYCNSYAEPLNLCGLSLGGVLALNYAIDNPAKVQSLTLIAAQYKMPKTLLRIQNIIFKIMPGSVFTKMGFRKKDFIALASSMIDLDFSDKLKSKIGRAHV